MNVRLIYQLPPTENNPRNSEGAFLRGKNGEILFAYSRYTGLSIHDHASCDIALIVSLDEGETWSDPRVIAPASFFGVANVMSVSAMTQQNGDLAFYFLIKENDFTTTLGRAVSTDGARFICERCRFDCKAGFYVINNDRLVRQPSGRILAPAAYLTAEQNRLHTDTHASVTSSTTLLYSDDDGASFQCVGWEYATTDPINAYYGLQEPGILQREDGSLFLWARTGYGAQYEAESNGDIEDFPMLRHGAFTSPPSPMQIKAYDGITYAVYNPIPNYNGRSNYEGTWGRTPLVIRKSEDGRTFGPLNLIEDDETRGYCYPAIFLANDGCLLLAYCRGGAEDGNTLCRLGITKIQIDTIQ